MCLEEMKRSAQETDPPPWKDLERRRADRAGELQRRRPKSPPLACSASVCNSAPGGSRRGRGAAGSATAKDLQQHGTQTSNRKRRSVRIEIFQADLERRTADPSRGALLSLRSGAPDGRSSPTLSARPSLPKRSIGISNYDIFLTRDCLAYSKIKPSVNQIETHPYFQRDSLVKFCQKHGICVTAHTPLGGSTANAEWFGTVSCLDDPVIKGLAETYQKTPAQLVLRWGIQRNTVVIPKTSRVERLQENFEVFDFEISKEDMDKMKAVDRKYRTNQPAKFWGIDLFA